ncbi:Glycoside hydrolase superfamily [Penicillium atrosanguineum]|uniref:Glycoside hydrolase superfamily n=2 Tax=Penicillium atrosanguineum TaxID=1132637 RepID=A0A9W9PPX9_9EURO|nr:Glycoside hydrolase superfamily [Penicillium atrosanguineum]KAJ5136152.1 Glycoside hydrolase superfamily [Penicillium atrosanguineum]KAJ5303475.1 Glycoside hydrolase superfamily [Penicillium atrosanguineum]
MNKPPGHPGHPALPAPAPPLGLPELPKPQLPNLPFPKLPLPQLPELPLQPHSPHPAPHPPAPHADSHRRFGISYSPYKANRACKSQAEVNKDLDQLSDYKFIRIYGTDCDQTKLVANAARIHNMKVFGGIYDLSDFPASLESFNQAAIRPDGQKDWSIFHTIAVGNELVNAGMAAPGDVAHAVKQARTILRGQGYQGPVVTVDTFSVLLKHPELCKVSDYCAANCHAFFDATEHANNAGPYALEQAHGVSQAAGGKHTMITESGWPHAGQSNGAAVPSPENQRVAVESLRKSFAHRSDDLVLFTAFDDLWKDDNRWTFNAERFWGIHHE